MQLRAIAGIFLKTGATAFGGWSTTSLLLEQELVNKRHALTSQQVKKATTYALVLPGGTQVAIVAHAGYRLRGLAGALVATIFYLLPAFCLTTAFAALYFNELQGSPGLARHMGGLIAALAGVILANAYKIGRRSAVAWWLWGLVVVSFAGKFWLGANAVLIIVVFGMGGALFSWLRARRAAK